MEEYGTWYMVSGISQPAGNGQMHPRVTSAEEGSQRGEFWPVVERP